MYSDLYSCSPEHGCLKILWKLDQDSIDEGFKNVPSCVLSALNLGLRGFSVYCKVLNTQPAPKYD